MAETKRPTPEQLQKQIEAYRNEFQNYKTYAKALRRVLERACKLHLREAIVTGRPKDVSSFAEKCIRRFETYPDAINQMNDLCGGRVVVQTQSQVESVRRFVEENFKVVETEDIGMRLGDKEFGYRDRHYIVQVKPERARAVGFKPTEIKAIGERKAELQIRTWAQHAWADTLHDRTYKTPIKLSAETQRTSALLAALMEDGDRNFDRLANELDGLVTNYAAYADKDKVLEEISLQQFLYDHETDATNRPRLALPLARLRAALGQHEQVVALLRPLVNSASPVRDELQLEYGTALCRKHRLDPTASDYRRGRDLLGAIVKHLGQPSEALVANLRKQTSLLARALARLGWAWEAEERHADEALFCYSRALELEPGNPYYLAELLGLELRTVGHAELTASLHTVMRHAIQTCESHATQGLQLPFAFFIAGRLRVLLGEFEAALHDYLRGARECLTGKGCFGCEVLDNEVGWLHRVNFGHPLPPEFQWAKSFLELARVAKDCAEGQSSAKGVLPPPLAAIQGPVLIVAGGAESIKQKTLDQVRAPLHAALCEFSGTVISGGTKSGVPGLVGEITARLKSHKAKRFRLLGYRPKELPDDAPKDDRYDESIPVGEHKFTADQILANWTDILAAGIPPRDVRLLCIGGGAISAVECRMALALGASVGVIQDTGGAADALLVDPQWKGFVNLLPLPFDAATLRAFLVLAREAFPPAVTEKMARELHGRYVDQNPKKLPENMRPWEHLPKTYQTANLKQAGYAVEILRAAGFGVRRSKRKPRISVRYTKKEIELMAELEHGRWNIERLQDGWRYGKTKDEDRKFNPCLVCWKDLPDSEKGVKKYDRTAVSAFPEILAKAGLEVYRKG